MLSKRVFDICVALTGLAATFPMLFILGVLVKMSSPGEIIYRARRVGKSQRPFVLYKLRTMIREADTCGPLITAGDDERITPIGRLLRRTKLDELPSLWNVLKGDMSLVGPRPENERCTALYTQEQRTVFNIRPGITSFASIKYRKEEELLAGANDLEAIYYDIIQDKLRLDLDYLKTRNFWLDIKILVLTFVVLFK
jgi:lipopolysaccharide/colanic/teichoic acid biosynthesis glycosyltransferase